jgi:hypothetical protein
MKKHRILYQVVTLVCAIVVWGCSPRNGEEIKSDIVNIPVTADGKDSKTRMPKMEFEQKTHDFGKLIQGEKVSFTFKFKNTGNASLVLAEVVPSCSCTVAQFTKTPVQPGEEGTITVNFNSETKKGVVRNSVTVQANTYPSETKLEMTAMVSAP